VKDENVNVCIIMFLNRNQSMLFLLSARIQQTRNVNKKKKERKKYEILHFLLRILHILFVSSVRPSIINGIHERTREKKEIKLHHWYWWTNRIPFSR